MRARFSLQSLILAVTACAIGAAWLVDHRRQAERLAQATLDAENERRPIMLLQQRSELEVVDAPLVEALAQLQQWHSGPKIAWSDAASKSKDSPVTLTATDVPLATLLARLLDPLDLSFEIRDAGLLIVTRQSLRDQHAAFMKTLRQGAVAVSREQYEAAVDALANDPDDQAASLTMGRYLCFERDDWEQGLPLLAAVRDNELANAALADSLGGDQPADLVRLGDVWWELSEQTADADHAGMKRRAVHWYQKALPKLEGIAKAGVEKRLAESGVITELESP